MKWIRTITFLLFLCPLNLFAQRTAKQKELIQRYFKLDPEDLSPSQIVQHFTGNLDFSIDTLIARTETSLLYLRAFSATYNPFSIPIKKAELQFREGLLYSSSQTIPKDTILTLAIIGILDSTEAATILIKGEFKRLDKQITKLFDRSTYNSHRTNNTKLESWIYYDRPIGYPQMRLIFGNYYADKNIFCIGIETNYKLTFN